ncbi:SDR family oxidoreductase [Sporosarcina sp. ACRSM]|uniref:NAD(P)-dependent oxidoreductase n=1 Tax=Sporosarcina sp. ACRSM TaxID=2918216 RepID=UPI001EF633A5|nr:SDR family oxidoreductase [Sporosarcina sp. ACRSM]MCG7337608.1 SDR family oxidoreductase [Sporosarcina sp. ACRSM]
MKILVLGATGRVGSRVVVHALRDGHHVTALVRNPEKMTLRDENLQIVQGNVLNKQDVERAMSGMDIIISTLNTDQTTTLSESMPLILEAMEKENIKRILTVGTAGILQSRTTPDVLRYQSAESKRKLTRAAEEHHKAYEILNQSDCDWTIVCPTYLPDGELTGTYRVERDFLPEGGTVISVEDTADFTYQQITSTEFLKARVGIAY